MNCKITVFTPTYNRAYAITNLFESLKKQEKFNFEWVVVDDGSTDNTEELFNEITKDFSMFPIKYYKQSNGGKHRAINTGLDMAESELFFIVDSDDTLTPDATKKIEEWEKTLEKNEKFAGICANRGDFDGNCPNDWFSEQFLDKTFLDVDVYKENGKYVLNGERAICIYTDIFRKFKFPEFHNEKFVTEAVVYNRIAHADYKIRYYNDVIYLFEYKTDGLTKSGFKLFLNNPHGYGLWRKEKLLFTNASIATRFKTYYSFTCDLKDVYKTKTIAECLDVSPSIISMCKFINRVLKIIRR